MRGALSVLIVEDHEEIAHWMRTELSHAGWRAELARDAAEARARVRSSVFDVILVDIGLPDEDGIELCRGLREVTAASILMVTARQGLKERVQALDGGADDYVPKPFAMEELLARIRAVLRRVRQEPGPVLEVGDVRLWPEERRVEWQGREVVMGRREFDLLHALMRRPRQVHRRDGLLEAAWGYDFDGGSNVVDVTVGRLRERLVGTGVEVVAVRGVGYRLELRE